MGKRERGKQLRELEWVGGRFPAPMLVGEEDPARPDMILWLELPSDLIVAHEIVEAGDRTRTLASAFERALSAPLAGPPRRPASVRVEDNHLAAELRVSLGDDIELVVAPTPELGAVVRLMLEHSTRTRGGPAASYFGKGRISEHAVAALFEAAALLHPVVPWKRVNHIRPMRIDIPTLGVAGGCVVAIGAQGESFGILLFPSRLAFDAFSEAAEHNQAVGRIDSIDTNLLALNFERASDLPASLRKEAATHRWRVASANAYPVVDRRSADGMSQAVTEHDMSVMTVLATALTGFYARHGAQLAEASRLPISEAIETEGSDSVRITIPYESFADFEPAEPMLPAVPSTTSRVGRNDKCPCGSGKKYKHCHLLAERSAQQPLDRAKSQRERDDMLVRELMRYAARRFPETLLQWRREHFDDIEAIDQFRGPLSLYHVPFEGRTILDWFLEDRGSKLAPEDLEILRAQRISWVSAWEARDVEPGVGMTLVDLLTGETRRVSERSGSRGLVERDGVLARVVEIGGLQLVCGMYPRVLPPEHFANVVTALKKWLKRTKKSVPHTKAMLDYDVTMRLCDLWQEAVADSDLESLIPPRLSNTDGDPLLITEDHYVFEPADGEEIARRLAAMEGVVAPEPGESCYDVLRAGNKLHADWENTIIGHVFVSRDGLRIETNSIARGDALCERIETALVGLVRHRARSHDDPVSTAAIAKVRGQAKGTRRREHEVPPELVVELQKHKADFYRTWLDQPIPALGGKTPRQAARTKGSRAQLDVLLKTIENREAREPVAERLDVSALRAELGLER